MKAIAVIGAMFGDEGKGRMVDHFAAHAPSVVVRYNGGGQAGHTVVRPDGASHIFRHHGAGAFAGAASFLSAFFITNPYIWARERAALGFDVELFVDPASPLTTPYDMLINREIEMQRGSCGKRHGTCGLGVGETIERLVGGGPQTFVGDIGPGLPALLKRVRSEWVPRRIAAMPGSPSDEFMENIDKSEPIDLYLENAEAFRKASTPGTPDTLLKHAQVIFEGAQGLGLDESHMFFPHVTRSRTGLANISRICRAAGIDELEAVYTTRAYATRHGEGPFPTFDPSAQYDDPSNAPNEFQGSMRFGHLDLDLLRANVTGDLGKAAGLRVSVSAAVTCLDQVTPGVTVKEHGHRREVHIEDLGPLVSRTLGANKLYLSKSRGRAA